MKLPRRTFLRLSAAAAALRAASPMAWAQAYPSRPVRVIVPFAPGGQVDVIARLIAQHLSEQLGQQSYVENAAGGGGTIGSGRAAQAAPDGYTILVHDGIAFTANPSLYSKVPYDAVRDFDPVTIPATTMQVLAVHPSVPAHTIQELVAVVKANPGKYSYASAGVGTGAHLTGELFRNALGLDLVHVPYNSGGQSIAAAVGGHTPISFGSPAATIPQVNDGKLRALAVGGKKRVRELPDIPTMREAGFPDVECDAWQVVLAPAGVPKDIVALLHGRAGASDCARLRAFCGDAGRGCGPDQDRASEMGRRHPRGRDQVELNQNSSRSAWRVGWPALEGPLRTLQHRRRGGPGEG